MTTANVVIAAKTVNETETKGFESFVTEYYYNWFY